MSEQTNVVQLPSSAPAGGAIFRAIPAIMQEVGYVGKDRKNQQQGYSFRGIDDIYAAVQLVLAKHGVFVVPRVLEDVWEERTTKSGGAMLHVRSKIAHTFYASDGSSVEAVTFGEGMDSGDKSSNKAMSSAMKYALLEVLCIPTNEPKDPEEESPEVAPKGSAPKQSSPATAKPVTAAVVPWFERAPNKMKRLQAAITKLNLGKAEADSRGLRGEEREKFVRDTRLKYMGAMLGREVTSTLALDEAEADKVTLAAENGEFPEFPS